MAEKKSKTWPIVLIMAIAVIALFCASVSVAVKEPFYKFIYKKITMFMDRGSDEYYIGRHTFISDSDDKYYAFLNETDLEKQMVLMKSLIILTGDRKYKVKVKLRVGSSEKSLCAIYFVGEEPAALYYGGKPKSKYYWVRCSDLE
jgi:hypothetical protein